jgi:hypothetical protein
MSEAKLHSVELPPTDSELAQTYLKEMNEALAPVCKIMDRALRSGMKFTFNVSPDAFGIHRISAIEIVKRLG